jgi:hypothetical protein
MEKEDIVDGEMLTVGRRGKGYLSMVRDLTDEAAGPTVILQGRQRILKRSW